MEKVVDRSWAESKKMWVIAGPTILTSVFQFSISFVTVVSVGHLGNVELAAVSIAQNVIEGFAYGIMLGMASALETLSGQAVGAGQIHMLGIYMQRSWIITGVTAMVLTPLYIFTSPILKILHQATDISDVAGRYSIWVIPQLFAYAVDCPLQKFFESQSRVWVMTAISGVVLAFHVLLNWLLVTKLEHGLAGAAIAGNISWWVMNLAQLTYLVSGYFPDAWTGFSFLAFQSLSAFLKLSLVSGIMLWLVIRSMTETTTLLSAYQFPCCLHVSRYYLYYSMELWYVTAVILLVGGLKQNTEIAVDAVSICMNLEMWTLMIALGFHTAVSVRVSNELGAGRPKAAKLSAAVAVTTSALLGVIFMAVVLITQSDFPKLFTEKPVVVRETSKLGYLLAATIFLNSIQPVLHGVAIGAGWQSLVALINTGCYYLFGLPIAALLGYKFKLNAAGIWSGMLAGILLQTVVLLVITLRTKWEKEALQAEERVRTWGGPSEPQQT